MAATGAKGEAGKAVAAFLQLSCPPSLIEMICDSSRMGVVPELMHSKTTSPADVC